MNPKIGFPKTSKQNAATYLVCRLFTDAIFNQDIRAIQLIINRIDGGLPKDVEVDEFKTEFGDCLCEILEMEDGNQLVIKPDDSVMMSMCKSLYDMAVQDIYFNYETGKRVKPSSEKKQERDTALRMILERVGGRRTNRLEAIEREELENADWIAQLPEFTCSPGETVV